MTLPPWLHPFQRTFPSANMALIRGETPVLIDTGFGSDLEETEALLKGAGVPPESLSLIVNTHYHCDHVGGNHALQTRYGLPVAAHRWEGSLVNRRDAEACGASWLRQPVEPYRVDKLLSEGDVIDAGGVALSVLHTPGHTLGHVSFYEPQSRVLILGDAVHGDDAAWLNPFREGVGALERATETLERLLELDVRWALSGHGAAITEPKDAFARALKRYRSWSREPERMAWHGVKRIFAYALMLERGLSEEELEPYLFSSPWFHDYSRYAFGVQPAVFVAPLLAEMLRSDAALWRGGKLMAVASHQPPRADWSPAQGTPRLWPEMRSVTFS